MSNIQYSYFWDPSDPAKPLIYKTVCNPLALCPDNATRVPCPDYKTGTIPCWNGEKWIVRADWRQEIIYDIHTGEQAHYPTVDIDLETFDTRYTTKAPRSKYDTWNGSEWVIDNAKLEHAKVTEIKKSAIEKLNLANLQIEMINDTIDFLDADERDASVVKSLLAEWKKYRGALLAIALTRNTVLPEQPKMIEELDG